MKYWVLLGENALIGEDTGEDTGEPFGWLIGESTSIGCYFGSIAFEVRQSGWMSSHFGFSMGYVL